ncbi:hypothetical protein Cfor_12924 [Coptotermes formosanus]|uniref:Uncharacterized protein n=1 Tax=Coptotermes formosanus TaxID=36987 RepID=A0A6L2PMU4_COPFO|nr:hypothetical protein Cfor_12924 [Coptotermes formosanus]
MVGTLVEIRNQDLAIHGNGGATSLLKSVKKNSRIRVKNTVQSYADTVYKAKGVPVDTVSVMGTRFICLCCVRILPEESVGMLTKQTSQKDKEELVCPPASVTLPVFSFPCKTQMDCDILGQLCCNVDGKMRCRKGVPRPTPKPVHMPLLGFIPRECPTNPVIEILPVKNCTSDSDCWPRICCPDGQQSYCRTSVPASEETSGFNREFNIFP